MDSTPTTPTNVPEDITTEPNDEGPFFHVDYDTQLEVLFAYLGLKTNPDAVKALDDLNKMTDDHVKFVTMTSGKNAGERRQVYHDAHGKAYYKMSNDKKHTRRIYLEDYIDAEGKQRHATASTVLRKQYKRMMKSIVPTVLFGDPPVDTKVPGDDDDVSVDNDASVEEEVIIKDEDDTELSL